MTCHVYKYIADKTGFEPVSRDSISNKVSRLRGPSILLIYFFVLRRRDWTVCLPSVRFSPLVNISSQDRIRTCMRNFYGLAPMARCPLVILASNQFRHLTIRARYPRFHLTRADMSFRRFVDPHGFEPQLDGPKPTVLPLY